MSKQVCAECTCGERGGIHCDWIDATHAARAEIERLEKEVEEAREGWNVETPNIQALLDTAWNDAIEAAATVGQDVAGGLTGACILALKRPTP